MTQELYFGLHIIGHHRSTWDILGVMSSSATNCPRMSQVLPCDMYTEKVRTNVSSVSSKYITAKVCHESHHCPICGLHYTGEFTGTIDIDLAVCLIKTFCLTE